MIWVNRFLENTAHIFCLGARGMEYWIVLSLFFFRFIDNDQPTVASSTDSPVENQDTVVLTCTAFTPEHVIAYAWYKGDAKEVEETGSTMDIGNSRDNSGSYKCEVRTASKTSDKSAAKTVTFLCKYIVGFTVFISLSILHICSCAILDSVLFNGIFSAIISLSK